MGAGLVLLPPARFRFTEPDDVDKYGGEWVDWDESRLTRIPTAELVQIEQTIGMSVITMLLRDRREYVDAKRAVLWVARKLDGYDDDWGSFDPLVLLVEWDLPGTAPAGDADPPASSSSPAPAPERAG